ncbi:MAG: glycosyltransferase [Erysipelotrichaceae bacterium]
MKIMVFDVPAVSGGALSILKDYYERSIHDKSNDYVFVVSNVELNDSSNVQVLRFPWVKKSWFHRAFFDYFIASLVVRNHAPDRILSLQNIRIKGTDVYQTIYIHNALPFSSHKFSFFTDFVLWFNQNIIGKMVFESIREVDEVIVQTQWMKRAILEFVDVDDNKVKVCPVEIQLDKSNVFVGEFKNEVVFFYPASAFVFKNHACLIDACIKLKTMGVMNYRVYLTVSKDDHPRIKRLSKVVENFGLPVEFLGSISPTQVMEFYSRAILVFPSYLETVGLPLLEAKICHSIILASDTEFSHDALGDYPKCHYFDPFDSLTLADLMKNVIQAYYVNPIQGKVVVE